MLKSYKINIKKILSPESGLTKGISSPLLARSVASSSLILEFLNSLSAASLSVGEVKPCSLAQGISRRSIIRPKLRNFVYILKENYAKKNL